MRISIKIRTLGQQETSMARTQCVSVCSGVAYTVEFLNCISISKILYSLIDAPSSTPELRFCP